MEGRYLCEFCGSFLSSHDTFRRHLKTVHCRKTSNRCSTCRYSTNRPDTMRRHLKSNQHSLKEKEVTTFIQDLLETPPQAKSALETSNYKADPSHINSYLYQQTMPMNKKMFPWVLHSLETPQPLPRIYKPLYLLTKDTISIPLENKEDLKDPRLEHYPSTSPSWASDLTELDLLLRTQLEDTVTDTQPDTDEKITPTIEWTILDSIGITEGL